MSEKHVEDLSPHDRRKFFAVGLGKLVGPLVSLVEQKLPFSLLHIRTAVRPPGALPERQFLDTCHRCGACADACPAHAITPTQSGDATQNGTPQVNPDLAACVICDDLSCMKVCPSGALRLVGRLEIRMGLARWNEAACLRSRNEACTICVDRCPLGATAIRVEDGKIRVIEPDDTGERFGEGCVGCGVCQLYCPTAPKSIIIAAY